MARGLKFWIPEEKGLYKFVAKTKALSRCALIMYLICTFVFAYAISRFSHDVASMMYGKAEGVPQDCATAYPKNEMEKKPHLNSNYRIISS